MNDLIEREDVIEWFEPHAERGLSMSVDAVIYNIKHIPSAKKQGEWIQKKQSIDGKYDFIWTECSECHQRPHDDFESDFCPNCGARMKKVDKEKRRK